MLEFLIISYLVVTLVFCFVKIRIGISMFLFYYILIPYANFNGVNLNAILPFLLLVAYFSNYGFEKLLLKPLSPFLFLYFIEFLLIPLHSDTPFETQIYFFFADFTKLVLPFVMFNVMNQNQKAISIFSNTLFATVTISIFYTLFLTLMPGVNPYLMVTLPLSGNEFLDWYASPEISNRIFGRISGVFPHPMTNGLFLCLSIVLIFSNLKIRTNRKFFHIIFMILSFIALFVIGVRTAIITAFLCVGVYLFLERRIKVIFSLLFISICVLLLLFQIPGMGDYINSIFDSNSSNIGGSSLEMRFMQLDGAFNEIRNNLMLGHGYGWNIYYQQINGNHPVLIAFESLIFMILCDSGLIGVFLWLIMGFMFVRQTIRERQYVNVSLVITLFSVYIFYSLITGEYSYMRYFLIFYSIIYMNSVHNYKTVCLIENDKNKKDEK